jgi:hypothetical protein
MDATPLCPAEHLTTAGQQTVGPDRQRRILDPDRLFFGFLLAMRQVDQDVPRTLGKGVAVEPGPLGRGQFRHHAGLEFDAVIARLGMFVGVALAIARGRVIARPGHELQRFSRRHQQHVEHVADPGSRQMGMRESHDRAVGLVIA